MQARDGRALGPQSLHRRVIAGAERTVKRLVRAQDRAVVRSHVAALSTINLAGTGRSDHVRFADDTNASAALAPEERSCLRARRRPRTATAPRLALGPPRAARIHP